MNHRAGVATDTGLQRRINEDRVLADEERGLYVIADGLGGHPAGERAAELATQIIAEQMGAVEGSDEPEEFIRRAITTANNEIYRLGQAYVECRGMACVLTAALVNNGHVTVGHVGDTRLYVAWKGRLTKLTQDHSPVGELEDRGELTEDAAMEHPRRNEVFRDVGSHWRENGDPDFVDTKTFPFRQDAALLLCSDGLSDVLTAEQIGATLGEYRGDSAEIARSLVESANEAGGKDNVSVIFIPGPEFQTSEEKCLAEARGRHSITRMRPTQSRWKSASKPFLWMLAGAAIAIVASSLLSELNQQTMRRQPVQAADVRKIELGGASERGVDPGLARVIKVEPADSRGIINALSLAKAGDTVQIPPGQYLGPLVLKEHVNLVSTVPHGALIRSDPAAPADAGVAIIARDLHGVQLKGLRILGDETHPLKIGILAVNSGLQMVDIQISDALESDIRIEAPTTPPKQQ